MKKIIASFTICLILSGCASNIAERNRLKEEDATTLLSKGFSPIDCVAISGTACGLESVDRQKVYGYFWAKSVTELPSSVSYIGNVAGIKPGLHTVGFRALLTQTGGSQEVFYFPFDFQIGKSYTVYFERKKDMSTVSGFFTFPTIEVFITEKGQDVIIKKFRSRKGSNAEDSLEEFK